MRKINALIAILLFTAPAFAQEQLSPTQERLRHLNRIRAVVEQEDEKEAERIRAANAQAAVIHEPGTSLGEMRWRVTDSVRNIREPFRCLDVDIEKNSAPVVLVCGGNSGVVAAVENNQVNSGNKFYSTPAGLKR